MQAIVAFFILAALYAVGDFVGTRTKAWVPSVFVVACLFLAGYWTFFPKDIVSLAGMGAPLGGTLAILFCITHMGTIISVRELISQWKIIVITLIGLTGMVLFCWFICVPLVGRSYVVAGLPPLSGGLWPLSWCSRRPRRKVWKQRLFWPFVCMSSRGSPVIR